MGKTKDTVLSKTIVLGDETLAEAKSLEELGRIAAGPEATGLSTTIILEETATARAKSLDELARQALGADELDFEEALGSPGAGAGKKR